MGWLDKIFGNREAAGAGARASGHAPLASAQFDDEEEDEDEDSGPRRNSRRDVLGLVLRDTMRRHGIPSDWIELRILSVKSPTRGEGMHILLVVRQGDDRLATYVHPFQRAFMEDLLKLEPRARDWVFSLSWQFEGNSEPSKNVMPDPASWDASGPSGQGPRPAASPVAAPSDSADSHDSELQEDLRALFRIRDEVLQQAEPADGDRPDFETTRPGFDESSPPSRSR